MLREAPAKKNAPPAEVAFVCLWLAQMQALGSLQLWGHW
jgi:hypothetical protein